MYPSIRRDSLAQPGAEFPYNPEIIQDTEGVEGEEGEKPNIPSPVNSEVTFLPEDRNFTHYQSQRHRTPLSLRSDSISEATSHDTSDSCNIRDIFNFLKHDWVKIGVGASCFFILVALTYGAVGHHPAWYKNSLTALKVVAGIMGLSTFLSVVHASFSKDPNQGVFPQLVNDMGHFLLGFFGTPIAVCYGVASYRG